MKKTILGLDLGTNSIGWALVDAENKKILGMGSRIIPMGAELSKFETGQSQTKNANRRLAKGARKLNKRYKQRRNKLIYALSKLGMMPDFIKLDGDFLDPNKIDRISILPVEKSSKQLNALEIMTLRKKALNEVVSLSELGRIFYLYNQMRGYAGSGVEPEKEELDENEEEKKNKRENFNLLCLIKSISAPEEIIFKGKNLKKYKIEIEIDDDRLEETSIIADTYLESLKVGEQTELQINIIHSKTGSSYFLKLPNKSNWRKKMENLEKSLKERTLEHGREFFISEYFLEILEENKWAKIRNNVVLRSRYEKEFDAIWNKQYELNSQFKRLIDDKEILKDILHFIFPPKHDQKPSTENPIKTRKAEFIQAGMDKGLYHVIKNQIIYFQRDLKDQSHLIANCRYEKSEKAISKSHPTFQEYRIWEQINKLNINRKVVVGQTKKGDLKFEYIDRPIPVELKEWIYEELVTKKEIGFGSIFKKLIKDCNFLQGEEFLNGLDPKSKIKANETRHVIKKNLKDHWETLKLDQSENLIELWEILYNGKGNEYDINSDRTSRILTYLKKFNIQQSNIEELAIEISKIKFARNYSSLSLKAIEKILPLTKAGRYFKGSFENDIHDRIVKLVNQNLTDPFEKSVQEYLDNNVELLAHGGIMNAYATMLVYTQHTEKNYTQNELIHDYRQIQRLKQGELRNPLAEQMINETLVIVKEIWKQYGFKPNEIRIELARELKNSADRRKKMHKANVENQKGNERVRERLQELNEEITLANIEKYKLWASQENLSQEFLDKYKDPSKSEIEKMKLWEEQGHISPYTGKVIPLSDLFNKGKYDVDHIIPKSRYFDDSISNKVIVEKTVNIDKGNRTAMEYIEIGSTKNSLRKKEIFIDEVNKLFFGAKRKNLLATKIPEDPILRQIKDTQYIAVRTKEELNKIVGNENVKSTSGGVTDYLRNQWGLTDKFKELLKSRYEKLLENESYLNTQYEFYLKQFEDKKKEKAKSGKNILVDLMDKPAFVETLKISSIFRKNNKLIIKDWSKRIDHRHHAIDALVIACTSQASIQQLNNLNKSLQDWLEKNREKLLPNFEGNPTDLIEEIMFLEEKERQEITKQLQKFREIEMPWKGFDFDAKEAVEKIIVSQKPKDKLLIQKDENGDYQIKIRGQLHEGTLYGKAGSGANKKKNAETYRIPLEKLAGKKFATEKTIEKITNEYLRKELKNHLEITYNSKKEEAFSAEGILELNKRLKNHTPISKIKIYYQDPSKRKKSKVEVDEMNDTLQRLDRKKAYNQSLFVKTGDNYLFAVMEKEEIDKKTKTPIKKRVYDIITFFDAANLLKSAFNDTADKSNFNKIEFFKNYFEEKNKAKLLFTLKQGDYVYLPESEEEVSNFYNESFWIDVKTRNQNVFIVQKYSGNRIYFIRHNIANPIKKGIEFGSQDAQEKIGNISIKERCIKINIDRLGNISNLVE
jgi:CRISPR-associated endonuclease Csn1